MSLKRLAFFALLCCGCLASGTALEAQQIQSPFRYVEERQALSPFVGSVSTGRGFLELGPESGTMFGLRYNIQISGPITLEAEIGYLPSTRTVFRVAATQEQDSAAVPTLEAVRTSDLKLLDAVAAMRFNLTGQRTWRGLMPYLVFGGGGVFAFEDSDAAGNGIPADEQFEFGTSFAGALGAGVEWFASRRLTVRVDARDLLWKLETPTALFGTDVPDSEWVQNFVLSAGVGFRF